jgi:hypothetical protein
LTNDYCPNKIRVIYFAILTIGSKNTDFLAIFWHKNQAFPAQAFFLGGGGVESKTYAGKVPQRHLVNELESKRFRRKNERKPRSRLFVVYETHPC